MTKYYCPSCGKEVIVTYIKALPGWAKAEVIVTCNHCLINARGYDESVLDLFRQKKSFDWYEAGRRAVADEDYKIIDAQMMGCVNGS
jgi:hypothetical protein